MNIPNKSASNVPSIVETNDEYTNNTVHCIIAENFLYNSVITIFFFLLAK